MGGMSYNPAMSDEVRVFQEQQDAETRQAFREAGVDVEGLSPQQYNAAIQALGEWRNLPENRAYRNQRSAIGKFVDSIGGPAGLFALTAGGIFLAGGGLGAAGAQAGGLGGIQAPTAGSLMASGPGAITAAAPGGGVFAVPGGVGATAAGSTGLGAALSSAAGKVGSVISGAAGALGGGGSMGGLGTALALGGAEILGGIFQARAAEKAAKNAAQMQGQATEAQLAAARDAAEQLRASQEGIESALAPFTAITPEQIQTLGLYQRAGTQALEQQAALAGLQGPEAQQAAVAALEASPQFQALARQGEEAILQQSAATGGLRGGNVQAALAQFRPAMLQQYIDQQYGRLGGLSGQGLATTENLLSRGYGAATNLASLRQTQAANLANLISGAGEAQAAGLVNLGNIQQAREGDQGQLISQALGGLANIYGRYQGGYFAPRQPGTTQPSGFASGFNPAQPLGPAYNPGAININAGLAAPII